MKSQVGKGFRVEPAERGGPPLILHWKAPDRIPLRGAWCGPVCMEGDQVWCASSCGPIEADAVTTATVKRLEREWEKFQATEDSRAEMRARAKRWGLSAAQTERLMRPPPRAEVAEMAQRPLFSERS